MYIRTKLMSIHIRARLIGFRLVQFVETMLLDYIFIYLNNQ